MKRIIDMVKNVVGNVAEHAIDIMFIAGLTLVGVGLFTWHPTIGFIGTGSLLMIVSFLLFKGGE